MINESFPNIIIFNDSSVINPVSELDSHTTRLSYDETVISDYLKKKEISIISSGLTRRLQSSMNFLVGAGVISNLQYVIKTADMSKLSGLRLVNHSPLYYIPLPALFGFSFRSQH